MEHDGQMGPMGGMDGDCSEMMQAMMGQHDEPARPNEQWRGEPAPQDDLRDGPQQRLRCR